MMVTLPNAQQTPAHAQVGVLPGKKQQEEEPLQGSAFNPQEADMLSVMFVGFMAMRAFRKSSMAMAAVHGMEGLVSDEWFYSMY